MKTFDNIILTGRAGCGKSELIDFLKGISLGERLSKYHIGQFMELDDHQWFWELGENDDMWERLGRERIYTKNVGCGYVPFDQDLVYDGFLNMKMNRELMDISEKDEDLYGENTIFAEFARGGKFGYEKVFKIFHANVLKKSAIFFIDNSYEESIRRNNARFEESKKHSVLAHKVPDEEMESYYLINDWQQLTGGKQDGYLDINGISVPFVTVLNEPEVLDPKLIEERFSPPLKKLWELYAK
jgi:hypothetical protein